MARSQPQRLQIICWSSPIASAGNFLEHLSATGTQPEHYPSVVFQNSGVLKTFRTFQKQ